MENKELKISYQEFAGVDELSAEDAALMQLARIQTGFAYAPYSGFRVGAVARMSSGDFVRGSNQENASFPAGLCAERVMLSAISSNFPDDKIETIAISYGQDNQENDLPISPCGLCRQTLHEYELRNGSPVRLLLSGQQGPVWLMDSASLLLPLPFHGDHLKG